MKVKRSELSECEVTVMKCIWDAKEPVTCAQVMETLKEKYGLDYKSSTVYTFLKTLRENGFVSCEKKDLTYYMALKQEDEYRKEVLKKTKNFWFGGSPSKLLSALVEAEEISEKERKELKRLIDGMDRLD